jgi:hypothetical protein
MVLLGTEIAERENRRAARLVAMVPTRAAAGFDGHGGDRRKSEAISVVSFEMMRCTYSPV